MITEQRIKLVMFCLLDWCQAWPSRAWSGPAQRSSKKGRECCSADTVRPHRPGFAHLCKLPGWGKIPPPGSALIGWSADNQPMRSRESATTVEWDPPKSKFSRSFHLMGQRTSGGRLKQTYPVFSVATTSNPGQNWEISGVSRGEERRGEWPHGCWWWLLAADFNISCLTTACTACTVVCNVSDNLTRHPGQPRRVWRLGDCVTHLPAPSVANRIIHHPQLSQYQLYPPSSLPPSHSPEPRADHSHRTSEISHVRAWLM